MKEVNDIWFKQNSLAREWLAENVDLEDSFSKTFRTAGGTFQYYKYEYLLRRCIINECHKVSVGSFSSNGGVKVNLCQSHLEHLIFLQSPPQLKITFWPFVKFSIPQLIAYIVNFPIVSQLIEISQNGSM